MNDKEMNDKGKYFVVSDGDIPQKICFSLQSAKERCLNHNSIYIDIFDESGMRIEAIKLLNDRSFTTVF